MTCRDEVLAAFEALHARTGIVDFAPAEVLAEMRARGSGYQTTTIRTHVTAHMVEDQSLVRNGRARYRLARHRGGVDMEAPSEAGSGEVGRIAEDTVKAALKAHLESDGWAVTVAWGRERGIDIDARRGTERLIVEAKGEAPAGPQQVNYFLGALGELVQRMGDPAASYGLALPDHRQYRGLVERLPGLARERLHLRIWFVRADGAVSEG